MAKADNPNLKIYNDFRSVPDEAKKTIAGGKLKGFTDINPMWRIKSLTEKFGVAGFGWYTDQIEKWVEEGKDSKVVFVKLNLYVKIDGEWSQPIAGIGGSRLESYVNGKNGQEGYFDLNDEAYKMAYTDALSIACKALGMAADVYYSKDTKSTDNRTKYDEDYVPTPAPVYKPCDYNTYQKIVAGAATGQLSKSGKPLIETWKSMTHPGAAEIRQFKNDVTDYKVEHNLI